MADIYTVRLNDQVSASAARVSNALLRIANSSDRLNRALLGGNKRSIQAARAYDRLARSELRAAKAAMAATNPTKSLTSQFGSLRASLLGVAAAWGATKVLHWGGALLDTAVTIDNLKRSFKLMYGEAKGAANMKWIDEFARAKGLAINDTMAQFRQFGMMGFDEADSRALVKFGAAVQAVADPEQLKRTFLAIGQIKAAGRLQGDELRQLEESGVVSRDLIFNELQRKMGVDRTKLMKLKEAGAINADDAVAAIMASFLRKMQAPTVNAGVDIPEGTLGRNVGKVSASLEKLKNVLAEAFTPALNENMGKLADALGRITEKDMRSAADGIGWYFSTIWDWAKRIFGGNDVVRDWAAGAITTLFSWGSTVIDYLSGFNSWVWEKLSAGWSAAYEWGSNVVEGFVQGLRDWGSSAVDTISDLGSNVAAAFKNLLGISSPSKLFREYGGNLSEGLALGIEAETDLSIAASSDLAEGTALAAEQGLIVRPTAPRGAALGAAAGAAVARAPAAGGGGRPVVNLGGVTITATGGDSAEVVQSVWAGLEEELAAIFERHVEGVGGAAA